MYAIASAWANSNQHVLDSFYGDVRDLIGVRA